MSLQFEEGSGKFRPKTLYSDFTRMLLFEYLYSLRVVFPGPLEIFFSLVLSKTSCYSSHHLTCFSIEHGQNTENLSMFPLFIFSVNSSKPLFKFTQFLYQAIKLVQIFPFRLPIFA